VLEAILTKTIHHHHKDWVDRLPEALWAYRTTWRNTTGFTPYELVYGKRVVLPIEFEIKTLSIALQVGLDLSKSQQHRLEQINELDEIHQAAIHQTTLVQQQRAKWHDEFIKEKKFKVGDWALLFDSRYKDFKGKFHT
jgi:hypothetical protein